MDWIKVFDIEAVGDLVVLKLANVGASVSKIITPDTISEKTEGKVWEIYKIGPKVKPLEVGFEVGDFVSIIGQAVEVKGYKGFVVVQAGSICAKFRRIEVGDELSPTA